MKRILIVIALMFLATTASAGLISNHSTGMTGEDSLVVVIHNLDSLSQPLGGLDTLKVLVLGPSGDSVFAEILSAVSGRLARRSTGAGKYDTTYVYKAQVSDIDGTGTAGVYTIRFTTVSNETGAWLRFQKFEQFQVAGTRYSALASATTLDSAEVYQAARQALLTYNADSTIRSDTLITQLLDSLQGRDSTLYSTNFWTALIGVVAHAVWDAQMSSYVTTGTTGDYQQFAGDPDNYPTLTEVRDSVWEITDTRSLTDKAGFSLSGTQTFSNTGTWTGNLTGSVGSVTGNLGGNVNGHVIGSIGGIVADIAEQIADVTKDSIGSIRGGASSTSLNEVLNPFFNLQPTDTVSFTTATYTVPSTVLPGWDITGYSVGTGSDDYIAIENSPFAVESSLTGGFQVVYKVQRQMTGGNLDSMRMVSNPIKLFPGIYKFGIRHYTTLLSLGPSGTDLDSIVVDIAPEIAPNTRLAGFTVPQYSATWTQSSGQYIATDTITVRLKIRAYAFRATSSDPAEWVALSHAFLTPMGPNPWTISAATARAIPNSIGDSLQKAQSVNVDLNESEIAAAVWDANMGSHLFSGSTGLVLRDAYVAAEAVKDSVQRANGMRVDLWAIKGNSAAARGLERSWDSLANGEGKFNPDQVQFGPTVNSAVPPFLVLSNNNQPAVYFHADSATVHAMLISGAAGGMGLFGTGTGAPGLTADGQGSSPDVEGQFPVDADITLDNVTISCGGSGDNLVRVYARDTSGTDEVIADVRITVRYLSNMAEEGQLYTGSGGYADFNLPDGTFIVLSRKAGYMLAADTIVVAGAGSHYVDGYNTNRLNICTVYGYVTGLPKTGALAKITVSMPDKVSNTCDSTILTVNTMEVKTGTDGYFEFDVPYSACFGGAKYAVTVTPTSGLIQTEKLRLNPTSPSKTYPLLVPSQSTYRVVF